MTSIKLSKTNFLSSKILLKISLVSFVFLSNTSVFAATNDNISGILQRELELQLKKSAPEVQPKIQKQKEVKKEGVTEQATEIKGFRFSGNKLLTEEELQKVVTKWKERKLTFDDLKDVTTDIQDYYSSKNRLVKAILPPQEIKDGLVNIKIVEGSLGEVVVEQKSVNPRMSAETVKKYFKTDSENKDSAYIDTQELQRKILILNELPGVNAIGTYDQGKKEGESNFNVSVEDTPLFKGQVSAANYGSPSTGVNQAIGNFSLNNISGIGDLASINAIKSSGSNYGQIAYARPIGYDGLKVGVTATHLDYQTLSRFSSTDNQSEGNSKTFGANISYPVYKTSTFGTNVKLSAERKDYVNVSSSTLKTLSDYSITNFITGVDGYIYNTDKSSISYNASAYLGKLRINDASELSSDSTAAKTNGSFEKLTFNVSRNQPIAELKNTNWLISADGQMASKNLNSSEQLTLGGPYSVEAYPSGQGGGSEGLILKTELKYPYNKYFNFGPFLEKGFIKQYVNTFDNWQGSTNASNSYSLAATGISGQFKYDNLNIDGTMAYRIGQNPLYTSTGQQLNVDNKYNKTQLWLKVSYDF